MEDSEYAEKQENTGIGPASACRGESAAGRRRAVCMVNFAARDVRPHPEERAYGSVAADSNACARVWKDEDGRGGACPHASRRIAAHLGCGSTCARGALRCSLY